MGKSTISMAICNSYVNVYQRVDPKMTTFQQKKRPDVYFVHLSLQYPQEGQISACEAARHRMCPAVDGKHGGAGDRYTVGSAP